MNPQADPQRYDITPKRQPLPIVADYVPSEAFLESVGFFTPSSKRIRHQYSKQKTLGEKATADGSTKTVRVAISANHELGLPITSDLDYYRAFLKILDDIATRDGRFHMPVPVPTRRLLKLAGKSESVRERHELQDWFKRMTGTLIEGGLYRAKQKHFDDGFVGTVFAQVILTGQTMRDGRAADTNYVWLSPWWLSNYYYGHRRNFDYTLHRSLRKPIAKALVTLLETGWYATGGKPYTKRYSELCGEFLLAEYRQVSRIHEQLDPAHNELQRQRFLASATISPTADKRGFNITWRPGPKWQADQQARDDRRDLADRITAAAQPTSNTTIAPSDDEAEAQAAIVDLLVTDIIEYTGDRHSDTNWRLLVRECVAQRRHHLVHQAISETKAADTRDNPVENKGAHVNSRLRSLMAQFELPLSTPRPKTEQKDPAPAGARPPGEAPGSVPSASGQATPREST